MAVYSDTSDSGDSESTVGVCVGVCVVVVVVVVVVGGNTSLTPTSGKVR